MAEVVEDIQVEEPEPEVTKKSKKKDKQDRSNYPLKVNYCGVCSMPFEYCEYLADYDKCKRWWEEHFPDFFERAMKIGDGADGEGDDPKKRQKRGGRGVIKAKKQVEKSKITVGRVSRNKKKFVTVVKGLETHGVSLKEVAKLFGRHFSCGSSVSGDEIVIQGDFVDDVMVLLVEKYPEIEEDDIEDIGKQKR